MSNFNRNRSESNKQRGVDNLINLTHFLTCSIGHSRCILYSGDCNVAGPSVTIQSNDLQTLSDIILLPLISNQSSNHSDECTEVHNSIHKGVQMLFVVNVHKSFSQFVSGRECFSESNDLSSVHDNEKVKEFMRGKRVECAASHTTRTL